jgi:sodium-coupled neutral amino acid transporter 11
VQVRQPSEKTQTTTTLVLLGLLSALALVLRDVGFVVSFGGALLGSCVIYIYPALMFVRTMAKKIASGEVKETAAIRREVKVNYGIMALGAVFAVIGGSVSVLKALK